MNILTIDTSTDIELISVTTGGRTSEFVKDVKMSHSVTMFDSLNAVLTEAGIALKEINLIGVGVGPGSFTGVRIAVSTARMFAQILNIPLVGLTSQDIFAFSAESAHGELILAAFDAKKSRVFASLYRNSGVYPHEILVEAGDYSIESVLERVLSGERLLCIGDGCGKYSAIIEEKSRSAGFTFRLIEDFMPCGAAAARLTLLNYNKNPEKYLFYGNTVPFYARKSDAELAKEEKSSNNNK